MFVKILKLLLASLLWPLCYVALALPWTLGLIIVPVLVLLGKYETKTTVLSNGPITALSPSWAELWANPEDHVDGPVNVTSEGVRRWVEKTKDWPMFARAFSWSSLRNSVSGERLLWDPVLPPFASYVGDPHVHESWKAWKLHGDLAKAKWFCCWARYGPRAGLWIRRGNKDGTYTQIRLGWKIIPLPARWREMYAGLGLQFHYRRKV